MSIKFFSFTAILILAVIGCMNHQGRTVKAEPANVQRNDSAAPSSVPKKSIPNSAAEIYAKPQIPILCYHRIATGMKSDYEVSPSIFSSHMKILADSGYHSVSPAQLYDYLVFNKSLPEKPVMITFDDSRIEHFEIAAPVMEKFGFKGVFFIMTITLNKKNYMSADQIAQLQKSGHTVGLHSWDHVMVTKYKNADDWKRELVDPKVKLEKIIHSPVEYWAYPDGIFNHQSAEELNKYFKLSFILATPRDPQLPLQTVRRIIVTERSPQSLLNLMHQSFANHINLHAK